MYSSCSWPGSGGKNFTASLNSVFAGPENMRSLVYKHTSSMLILSEYLSLLTSDLFHDQFCGFQPNLRQKKSYHLHNLAECSIKSAVFVMRCIWQYSETTMMWANVAFTVSVQESACHITSGPDWGRNVCNPDRYIEQLVSADICLNPSLSCSLVSTCVLSPPPLNNLFFQLCLRFNLWHLTVQNDVWTKSVFRV